MIKFRLLTPLPDPVWYIQFEGKAAELVTGLDKDGLVKLVDSNNFAYRYESSILIITDVGEAGVKLRVV